ncbi:MAG: class B sortase [Oscillospiraceae bacterium]|jgi:sortase B|nr:class B sortase [Oscillospiraceae bacterium]
MRLTQKVLALLLLAGMAFGGYHAWKMQTDVNAEADLHGEALQFKPTAPAAGALASPGGTVKNEAIVRLRAQNPAGVGWLTIPHTGIDYPFVQAADNKYYLTRDLKGDTAKAGTIFMDYRNARDFSDFNTILYGHNLHSGAMFAGLKLFAEQDFFEATPGGTLFLEEQTYTLAFFAYLLVRVDDSVIYSANPGDQTAYLAYLKQNAKQYREPGLQAGERIVTLSTCAYDYNGARMVLLAVLREQE